MPPAATRAARFVARFEEFWADPKPDPETLRSMLTNDVRLVQPLASVTQGIDAACESFRRLFMQFPDLRAKVDRWSGDDTVVFIEFRLRATIGKKLFEWPAVDRFTLRGDVACERVSYFDGLPLVSQLLRRPLAAFRALRR